MLNRLRNLNQACVERRLSRRTRTSQQFEIFVGLSTLEKSPTVLDIRG